MLTHEHLAMIRAALLYWEEEMCPHDSVLGLPYFDEPIVKSLEAKEIAQIRKRLTAVSVRYALCDRDRQQLASTELFDSWQDARQSSLPVVTVLLPGET